MNLKLIERFLSAMMPPKPQAKLAVDTAFECMKAHPITAVPTITIMISRFQHRLYSLDEMEAANACALVLTGVMLAWASEDEQLKEIILEHYLEQSAKMRGENVVDFFDKKAGRGHAN